MDRIFRLSIHAREPEVLSEIHTENPARNMRAGRKRPSLPASRLTAFVAA